MKITKGCKTIIFIIGNSNVTFYETMVSRVHSNLKTSVMNLLSTFPITTLFISPFEFLLLISLDKKKIIHEEEKEEDQDMIFPKVKYILYSGPMRPYPPALRL